MQDDDFLEYSTLPAFAGLSALALRRLFTNAVISKHKRGEILLREGARASRDGVVLSGRLSLVRKGEVAGRVVRGGSFGRLSLVSGSPSQVTVVVRHDAEVLSAPALQFESAFSENADFAAAVMKEIAARLIEASSDSKAATKMIVSLFSYAPGAGKSRLAAELAASLAAEETRERILLLTIVRRAAPPKERLGFEHVVRSVELGAIEREPARVLDRIERHPRGYEALSIACADADNGARWVDPLLSTLSNAYRRIVIDLPTGESAATTALLAGSDLAFVLTRVDRSELAETGKLVAKLPVASKVLVSRVGLSDVGRGDEIEAALGCAASEFIDEVTDDASDVVRSRHEKTVRRLARSISDKLIGVAFSSGAARGLAHIGVIKRLEREGIEPDYIAGTSIGALIGAMWAMGMSAEELEATSKRIGRNEFFPLSEIAIPPSPSVIRGRRIDAFLEDIFGERTFLDLKMPMRIVAADLESGEEKVFDRGRLLDAVRASISIPGVLPPWSIGESRYIDGAVLDPVPVAPLRRLGVSRVIAVSVVPPADYRGPAPRDAKADAPRESMLTRLLSLEGVPEVMDIIMRANQFMESRLAEDCCRGADEVIRPWVAELGWLDFDAGEKFIAAGEHN